MNPMVYRMLLIALGAPLLIAFVIAFYEWKKETYPNAPEIIPNLGRIQHTGYHVMAVDALKAYSQLPQPDRDALLNNLDNNLISTDNWIQAIGISEYRTLCIGEFHQENTRKFLAENLFAKMDVDVLLLEATPKELAKIRERMDSGRPYFPLLKADIAAVIRTVISNNPAVQIYGIEETHLQQKNRRGSDGSRDISISHNFWERYQPGARHVILFGAQHCSNYPRWLFSNLQAQAPAVSPFKALNVQVLGEHQDGPLEAFVYFLDEIGVNIGHFVITDTNALHPFIYQHFKLLHQQSLKRYQSLIVFR